MTDPERVEALAEALHGLACTRHATVDACDYEADYHADAQALAPLLAEWRTADRAEALREVVGGLIPGLRVEAERLRGAGVISVALWMDNEADRLAAALAAEPDAGGECPGVGCSCYGNVELHRLPTAEPDAGGDRG